MDGAAIRQTRSVCPVCRKNIPAFLTRGESGQIHMEKTCPDHGSFRVPVWRGTVDFDRWLLGTEPLAPEAGLTCPSNCGLCAEHESDTCCVLLEVTKRCDLRCRYCFADGGSEEADPTIEECRDAIREIVRRCGKPLLQFSGGEPTMRDDLPELVRFAKEAGCSYTQLNTNGIRLAREPAYAERLAEAGLDIVFLQFDGTRNDIYETLRGRPLLETKRETIRVCSDLRIGVTLVPTVVKGVNDRDLGEIVALARDLAPGVRGVHFQPVSYFGRYPGAPSDGDRYTLDQLMTDISDQANVPVESFMPSRCDHPLCGFHASFLIDPDGSLKPLSFITRSPHCRGSAKDNREFVVRHWRRAPEEPMPAAGPAEEMDFDTFLYRVRHRSLVLSAMAFQDAMNLNIERLHRCSLHVYDKGRIVPFCARYLSPWSV
ncbi:MAG: radical SAM protein [Oscillospiraceae bacterium]|nr:radical SAM protein [Oscillospiraceae bacterium]